MAQGADAVRKVAAAAQHLREVQRAGTKGTKGGLRTLYRTIDLPGASPLKDAHSELDSAVLEAYGFSRKKDLLQQLLDLNLAVAASLSRGETVDGPGVPSSFLTPSSLVSTDCIR